MVTFHLKITLMTTYVFPVITIVFSAELLQGEHCINAIDSTNNGKISTMLNPLFHIPHLNGSLLKSNFERDSRCKSKLFQCTKKNNKSLRVL